MSLSFQPQSEEEVLNLSPAGIYDFTVINAVDSISKKSGNPMITLTVSIFDITGKEKTITDFILAAFMKKIRHFCETTGLMDKFNLGSLSASDCINKTGKLNLIVEEYNGRLKNSVEDYIKNVGDFPQNNVYKTLSKAPEAEIVPFDDDVPF